MDSLVIDLEDDSDNSSTCTSESSDDEYGTPTENPELQKLSTMLKQY